MHIEAVGVDFCQLHLESRIDVTQQCKGVEYFPFICNRRARLRFMQPRRSEIRRISYMIHVHKKKKAQLKKQTTRKQRISRIEKKENNIYQLKNHTLDTHFQFSIKTLHLSYHCSLKQVEPEKKYSKGRYGNNTSSVKWVAKSVGARRDNKFSQHALYMIRRERFE